MHPPAAAAADDVDANTSPSNLDEDTESSQSFEALLNSLSTASPDTIISTKDLEVNEAAVTLVTADLAAAAAKVLAVKSQLKRSIDNLLNGSAPAELAAKHKNRALTDFTTEIQHRLHSESIAASDRAAQEKRTL